MEVLPSRLVQVRRVPLLTKPAFTRSRTVVMSEDYQKKSRWIICRGCIFGDRNVRKLVMAKPKNPPQNAVGTSNGVLRNQIGTLRGMLGTVGGPASKTPKGAKK